MLPSRQPPILISPNSLPLATWIFCLCPVRKKVIMELGLSLGDNSRSFSFMEEPREASNQSGVQFNTTLSIGPVITKQIDQQQEQELLTVLRNKHKSDSTTEDQDHEATNESLLCPSLKANNKRDILPHFSCMCIFQY